MVGVAGSQALRDLGTDPAALSAAHRPAKAFFPPEATDALVVDHLSLSCEQSMCHPPAPARVGRRDGPETAPQLGFGIWGPARGQALC
jgi:hypothetical protein